MRGYLPVEYPREGRKVQAHALVRAHRGSGICPPHRCMLVSRSKWCYGLQRTVGGLGNLVCPRTPLQYR